MKTNAKERARQKAWRAAHPDYQRDYDTKHNYGKLWRASHPGYFKNWSKVHPGYFNQRTPQGTPSETTKAKRAELSKRWRENHRERIFLKNRKRRALQRGATVNLTGIREFVRSVKSKPFAFCYYCDSKISTTKFRALHFDHIIPLSKGGAHAVENLCVCCEPCNCSKNAKPLAEWLKTLTGQQLLTL